MGNLKLSLTTTTTLKGDLQRLMPAAPTGRESYSVGRQALEPWMARIAVVRRQYCWHVLGTGESSFTSDR